MAYTADDIIQWSKISQPLSARAEKKRLAVNGATVDIDHHVKLYVERKSVEWYNSQDTVDADYLYKISNWLWALTFPYGMEAQFIDGGSGGQVTPVTPSSRPSPLYFTVDATSYLANGDSSKTISDFMNYGLIFTRGGIPQSTVSTEPSYFSWNPATAEFTCTPAVVTSELIGLIPV